MRPIALGSVEAAMGGLARRELRRQHLDGDPAVQRRVEGIQNDPHAAAAQHVVDLVGGDPADRLGIGGTGEHGKLDVLETRSPDVVLCRRIRGLRELPGIESDRLLEPEAPANLGERFLAADAVLDVRAHNRRRLRVEFATRKRLQVALARTASPLMHGYCPSQLRNAYGLSPRAGPNATGKSRNGHLGGRVVAAAISDDGTHSARYIRG